MRQFLVIPAIILLSSLSYAQKFWLTTYEFPGGYKTGITLVNDTMLIVSTENYVLQSSDDGHSFDTILAPGLISTIFSTRKGIVFAGCLEKIVRSTDYGKTWDSVSFPDNIIFDFHETPTGEIFALTSPTIIPDSGYQGEGILFSDDSGKTWTYRNNGIHSKRMVLQITQDKNGRLYAGCGDEWSSGNAGLFISDNNGQSWQHITITIDGRGVIENTIAVSSVTSLEVTPEDSIIMSLTGVARDAHSGTLVRLNLVKHINDVLNNDQWQVRTLGFSASWWLDRNLNTIHFAHNGHWLSSISGSKSFGGTMLSTDNGMIWNRIDYGLGLDKFGARSEQKFCETSSGKIYMIQYLDERIYWSDTMQLSVTPDRNEPLIIYPNPVPRGEIIHIAGSDSDDEYVIIDVLGRVISVPSNNSSLRAPNVSGRYLIRSTRLGTAAYVTVY